MSDDTDTYDDEYGSTNLPPLHIGDHVSDRYYTEATMLVAELPTWTAEEYDYEGGTTVAEANPECDPEDDVVEVVFVDRTDARLEGKKHYAYPRGRLKLETPIHDRDDTEADR